MFSVMFEVNPKSGQWQSYLGYAKMLRPELERIDGFVDNIRYRSLTRAGWLLSLSTWRDEKALVRWRTQSIHHGVQEKGRSEVFQDYHLRVGQLTHDTQLPTGHTLCEQRLDETETGTRPCRSSTPSAPPIGSKTPLRMRSHMGWALRRLPRVLSHGTCLMRYSCQETSSFSCAGATRTPLKPSRTRHACHRRCACVASAWCGITVCSTGAKRRNITQMSSDRHRSQ